MTDPTPPEASGGFDAKIKSWWSSNKLLFFIALPVIVIFVFRDLVLSLLLGSARKVSNEAKAADEALKASSNQAEVDSAVAKAKADDAQKRIDDRKESNVDDEWYKKQGDQK